MGTTIWNSCKSSEVILVFIGAQSLTLAICQECVGNCNRLQMGIGTHLLQAKTNSTTVTADILGSSPNRRHAPDRPTARSSNSVANAANTDSFKIVFGQNLGFSMSITLLVTIWLYFTFVITKTMTWLRY